MKKLGNWLVQISLYGYLRLVFATSRVQWHGKDVLDNAINAHLDNQQPFVLCFWHGRLAMMPFVSKKPHRTHVMISEHGDGSLIAGICKRFGLLPVRGSSDRAASDPKGAKNRGGKRVMREALAGLKQGNNVAITPDGPRGPRMRVQKGVLSLSSMANVAVIPVSFSTSFGYNLKSWDRFLVPLPFGRIVFMVGEPVMVKELGQEKGGKVVENQLNHLTILADEQCGRVAVRPEENS